MFDIHYIYIYSAELCTGSKNIMPYILLNTYDIELGFQMKL
jgi:hypothetical protein